MPRAAPTERGSSGSAKALRYQTHGRTRTAAIRTSSTEVAGAAPSKGRVAPSQGSSHRQIGPKQEQRINRGQAAPTIRAGARLSSSSSTPSRPAAIAVTKDKMAATRAIHWSGERPPSHEARGRSGGVPEDDLRGPALSFAPIPGPPSDLDLRRWGQTRATPRTTTAATPAAVAGDTGIWNGSVTGCATIEVEAVVSMTDSTSGA